MRQFRLRNHGITVTITPYLEAVSHAPSGDVWMTLFGNGIDVTVRLNAEDINDIVRALIFQSERRE